MLLNFLQSTLGLIIMGMGAFLISTFVLFLLFKLKNPILRELGTNGVKGNKGNKMRLDTGLRITHSLLAFLFLLYILILFVLPSIYLWDYFYYLFGLVGMSGYIFILLILFLPGSGKKEHQVKGKIKMM